VSVTNVTATSATLSATSNLVGTGYWLVVPQGSTAPTAAEVKAGVDYAGVSVVAHGSGSLPNGVATDFAMLGLSPATPSTAYIVGEDEHGTLMSSPVARNFTTTPGPTTYTGPANGEGGTVTANLVGGGGNCGFDPTRTGVVNPPATPPSGYSFPHGLFHFRLVGCDPGSTVTLKVRWPGQAGGQYWKFNPRTSQWYPYPGASFNPLNSTWTFQIKDNGPHDADPTPGSILDPAGPAQWSGTGPGDPGGPGAGAQPIPTLSQWMLGALAGLLGLLVLGAYRRRFSG